MSIAFATINSDALKHNLNKVRQIASNSSVLAVIKANAYGHGMQTVSNALMTSDAFAVARLEEAIQLRQYHDNKQIVLLQGFLNERELHQLIQFEIQPVIHSQAQIDLLQKTALPLCFPIWLKIDTGMNRLGISSEEFPHVWKTLNNISGIKGNIYLMSHFANADNPEDPSTQNQISTFNQLSRNISIEKTIANSAGILSFENSHMDWVRPGIMLYGVSPYESQVGADIGLRPVMNLYSRIIAIKKLNAGESVGYGSIWQAEKESVLAVVGIGYGDGYPRHIDADTPVIIDGKQYPIVGRVSMDMLCVNLGYKSDCQIGDTVLLWGDDLPVEHIAKDAGTIAYELLCQVSTRVKFNEICDGKS